MAFDRNVNCKSVTLDGQVVDPGGSMTGGSTRNDAMLIALAQSKEIRHKLSQSEVYGFN